ncbi:hypothetical protein SAVIM338S_04568 [Streptomyces avidinii]
MFVDETTAGGRTDGWGMEIAEERLALRELIRRRICHEMRPGADGGRADPKARTEAAFAAFGRNGLLVLVGDRQITDLDEEIDLPPGTEVTFLKLVALVGG